MNLRRLFVLILLLIFILPVMAAIGWDVSDLVYLSSMSEEENHVGTGISDLVLLSSLEEDLGHIGESISGLVYLSSMSEEENHVGIGISELVLLSSLEEDLGHIGEGISALVYLSSISEDENHIGEGLSTLCLLSSLHYGDVDNNTLVESFDASLVLQYFCMMQPQGVPLPWEDWRQTIADVDGNTAIEAYDAGLILQYSVDMIDIFPVENQFSRKEVSNREITRKEEKIINHRRH
ncbi:MAG: hypothetical protein P9M05_11670 [Candidatus Stygibacter australis]|nr:hypothetical protein [Candidatus Stygibacter australis]